MLVKYQNAYPKVGGVFLNYHAAPSWPTVEINGQVWMAENLSSDDGGEGITSRNLPDVNGVNLGTQYYYTWPAAMRIADSIDGWHLPTSGEFIDLMNYAGGSGTTAAGMKLKSTSGWNNNKNGTDDYGFTWLPAGQNKNGFDTAGMRACLWSINGLYTWSKQNMWINVNSTDKVSLGNQDTTAYLSVRLIKDSE